MFYDTKRVIRSRNLKKEGHKKWPKKRDPRKHKQRSTKYYIEKQIEQLDPYKTNWNYSGFPEG